MVDAIAVEFMHAAATKLKHKFFFFFYQCRVSAQPCTQPWYNVHLRTHVVVRFNQKVAHRPIPFYSGRCLAVLHRSVCPLRRYFKLEFFTRTDRFFSIKEKVKEFFSAEIIRHVIDNPNEPIPAVLEIPSKKTITMMLPESYILSIMTPMF